MAQAQSPSPGVYIGAGRRCELASELQCEHERCGGAVVGVTPSTGWMAGGVIGYDFVGPRVELEGILSLERDERRRSGDGAEQPDRPAGDHGQPVLRLHAGVGDHAVHRRGCRSWPGGQQHVAGQHGVCVSGHRRPGWNVDTNFRVNLDGRYYGTSNPTLNGQQWTNNNFSIMLGLQLKFGSAPAATAAAAAGCCAAVVHGVLRLGPARTCRSRR